jgi:ubiquinol-cytochrome c reductase cytochrome c subunit
VEQGRQLYTVQCASCHGAAGEGLNAPDGSVRGPSLREAGEASAYYMLATGRMPLANSEDQPHRARPAYPDEQITALVVYVASLGDGPPLPRIEMGDTDLAEGGEVYRANCAPCHAASGVGGALSYGRAAPNLQHASPLEVAAAVRSGPGQMPVFDADVVPEDQLDDLVAYVRYLRDPEDPGGLPIGRVGPVPEGFVAWFFGIGAFLAAVGWIGTRSPVRPPPSAGERVEETEETT